MVPALEVRLRFGPGLPRAVGRLALAAREIVFQYDDTFLGAGLPISPLRLPVRPGVQVFERSAGMEMFGVFEDAMPDNWGRRLVERHFQETLKRAPGLLERLAFAGERASGALTFHPPVEAAPGDLEPLNVSRLAGQAWDFDDDKIESAVPELRRVAGTSGGARPKALIGLRENGRAGNALPGDGDLPAGYEHWIVKFNSRVDARDSGALEYAYAELAEKAGAEVPAHRLIHTPQARFFATRRFDRPAHDKRLHLHSAAGLLHADYRTPGTEYADLFRLTDVLTRDYAQKLELFRRACLNVLACNRDDHLKNFAYLMDVRGEWRLSPLYDFTFHPGPGGWQTLSVAGEGEHPRREHLIKLAAQVDLRPKDARHVVDQVRAAVAAFPRIAKRLKLAKRATELVRARMRELDQ